MQEVLALALKARGAIRHDTLALGGTNLSAEVGLSGFAELAFFTLWRAVREAKLALVVVILVPQHATWGVAPAIHQGLPRSRTSLLDVVVDLLESDDSVSDLHVGDTLTNALHNTGTLVAGNDRESTLGVLSAEHVRIGMADTGVVDLYPNLVGTRRKNLDILNAEVLASLPGHGGLAGDGLALGGRHLSKQVRSVQSYGLVLSRL